MAEGQTDRGTDRWWMGEWVEGWKDGWMAGGHPEVWSNRSVAMGLFPQGDVPLGWGMAPHRSSAPGRISPWGGIYSPQQLW